MLFRNAMQTPDGTVIESFHVHDYVTHKDANGETYMVDGGMEYLRRSINEIPAKDLSVEMIPGNHKINRQYFRWGTYGVKGDKPLRRIKLMDMSDMHIHAVLETQPLGKETIELFEKEIEYRDQVENK